jgi:RNA polymerase sigma-70 factor (ECF subfamily)
MALRTSRDAHLAQDLVQETYKEAWKSFKNYQPGTNCKAWLFKILMRVTQHQSRKNRRFLRVQLEDVPERKLVAFSTAEEDVRRAEILDLVSRIPEKYRTVLLLTDVEGLSYKEVAETLEVPLGTVMSRLNRARNILRERFFDLMGNVQTA